MLYSMISRLLLTLLLIGAVTDANATYVTMTSSEYGNVVAPATVTVGVNGYNDDDGIPIQQVNLFHNGQLIASNPYGLSHTFTGLQIGTHHFTGQAVADGAGASETITIQVIAPGGNLPTVTINAPTGGPFIAPATMTWTANASDSDGQVVRVEYYANGNHIGTATSAPYGITVNNVAVGTYSVYAKAVDNNGGATSSAPVSVTVTQTEVTGSIDTVGLANGEYKVFGWACSTGRNQSIDVHMYVGGAYGTGTFVAVQTANQPSEPAVAATCHAQGTAYRFSIPLTPTMRQEHANKKIYIHGISPEGGSSPLLNGSAVYSVPAPLALARRYVYDQHQRLCKVIEPETGSTVMEYDAAGNLAWSASGLNLPSTTACNRSEAQSSGRAIGRGYDVRNRLTALNFPDGRGNQIWTYTPDGLPQVLTTYNSANQGDPVVNGYSYNRRRMLESESVSRAGLPASTVIHGYDANGNPNRTTYPSGMVVEYLPNALGQTKTVRDTSGQVYASDIGYYPNGAIQTFRYGNGIQHTMTQNARQLPARSTDAGVLDHETGFDAAGNVSQILDRLRGDHYSRWMAYDDLNRLTAAGSCSFGGDCWHRFSYDALDNLRTWSLGGVKDRRYHYDPRNQLINIKNADGQSIIGLGYDAQGNLSNKNGVTYDFDYGNRLREVKAAASPPASTCTSGPGCLGPSEPGDGGGTFIPDDSTPAPTASTGILERYLYDAGGLRVLTAGANGNVTSHYAKSGQLVRRVNEATSKETEYVYLAGSQLVQRERTGAGAWAVKYQHTDALGSPVAATDANRTVLDPTDWEPYGAAVNKPAYDGVGYTGHVMDGATGMTYMQQRYYDADVGRMLSVDPVSVDITVGANFGRYVYANNNPYRFTDPDGRQSRDLENEYRHSGASPPKGGNGPNLLAWGVAEALCGFCDLSYTAPSGSGAVESIAAPWEALIPTRALLSVAGRVAANGTARLADNALVVRGGSPIGANSVEGLAKGIGDHPSGVRGFSAESANGATLCQLCSNVAHNQVGVTTAGQIRASGGEVVRTAGKSPTHVTVSGLKPDRANQLLTPTRDNPVPKLERRNFD
ncbi:Ig-like domain-containing protein [Lysobacter sp. ESA13C]|uniref:RHS repeat domain-containing protein n=1 Tax=Lysobacter sp. ESA13C TaxID=2862676 RepID=UPI001CBC2A39|nr:Ig-like domain-containing protein [Lysobacter sp. ESA13C]